MEELELIGIFIFVLFLLLGTGVWVGLALLGVAFVGMELFTSRPAGDAMVTTIWTASSSSTSAAILSATAIAVDRIRVGASARVRSGRSRIDV